MARTHSPSAVVLPDNRCRGDGIPISGVSGDRHRRLLPAQELELRDESARVDRGSLVRLRDFERYVRGVRSDMGTDRA